MASRRCDWEQVFPAMLDTPIVERVSYGMSSMHDIWGWTLKWWVSPTKTWFFLLKMIILGCEMGVPPFKETPISHLWKRNKSSWKLTVQGISGWWFQIFVIFIPIWGRFPCWLIFFRRGWNRQPDMLALGRVNRGELLYTSLGTHKNLHF